MLLKNRFHSFFRTGAKRLSRSPRLNLFCLFPPTVFGLLMTSSCVSAQSESEPPRTEGFPWVCGHVEIEPGIWWRQHPTANPEADARANEGATIILMGGLRRQARLVDKDLETSDGTNKFASFVGYRGRTPQRCLAENAIKISMYYSKLPNGALFRMNYKVEQFGRLLGENSAGKDISDVLEAVRNPRNSRMIGEDIELRVTEIYQLIEPQI